VGARDGASQSFWRDHFAQVFDDHRHTFLIRDPRGERVDHIAQLRGRIRGLRRALDDHHAPMS
jgi:hypothetical protein